MTTIAHFRGTRSSFLAKGCRYAQKVSWNSTRKGLSIYVATALVDLFPPKHHLRAARILDDVLDGDPDNIPCLMGRAAVYQYSRNWKKAEELFARVEALKCPEDMDDGLEAREQKVWCMIQAGQVDDGIAELRIVINILDALRRKEVRKARAWWRLGQSVWDKGGKLFSIGSLSPA